MSAKSIKKQQKIEEQEINFIKILRFMAWIFIVAILIIAAYFLIKAIKLNLTSGISITDAIGASFTKETLILWFISGVAAGLLFSAASQIKENPSERKQPVFKNLIISMAIVEIIFVWVVSWSSPYQW